MTAMHLPPNLEQIALSNSELLTFSVIQDGGRPPPWWIFKSCTFGTFCHVNSVVLELYIKFGSNICDSHWDQHTYAHLMTSRELTSGFDFWPCLISAWPWCICSPTFAQIALSNSELLSFFEIQDGDRRHLGFSVYVNLAIPTCR